MESRYPRGLRKDELIDLVKVYNEIYSYFIKAINTGLIELVGLVFLFIFGRGAFSHLPLLTPKAPRKCSSFLANHLRPPRGISEGVNDDVGGIFLEIIIAARLSGSFAIR